MSAQQLEAPGRYRIELTAEQFEGLKTVLSYAQVCLNADIRQSGESVTFWVEKGGHEKELALAQTNLTIFRGYLLGAKQAEPAVFGAEFVPTRGHKP